MVKLILLTVLVIGATNAMFFIPSKVSCDDKNGGGETNGGCGAGWRRLNRPSGGWCIRVFEGVLTQADAEAKCKSRGATLSGLKNAEEARIIADMALPVLNRDSGSVWIGARRTDACMTKSITSDCTATNSFTWTDGSTSGTAGFVWDSRQPDNDYKKQPCVILLSSKTPETPVSVKNRPWLPRMIDDVACSLDPAEGSARIVAGYVCGKKSSQ